MAEIYIEGDSGTVLIDDTYRNMTLYSKGVAISSTGPTPVGRYFDLDIPRDDIHKGRILLAIKSPYFSAICSVWDVGGVVRYKVLCEAPVGTAIQWYAFSLFEANPIDDGIITLRNADGFVTFNSDANYLRVSDFVFWDYDKSFLRHYKDGRQYAAITCNRVLKVESADTPGGWSDIKAMGTKVSGSSVTFGKWDQRGTDGDRGTFRGGRVASALVVDVTGL